MRSTVWLYPAALILAAACSRDDGPTAPDAGGAAPQAAAPGDIGDLQLLMTSPGMRWFRSHTHSHRLAGLLRPPSAQVVIDGLDVSFSGPTDLTQGPPGLSSLPQEINPSGLIAGTRTNTQGSQNSDAIRWNSNGNAVVLHKRSSDGQAWAMGLNDAGVVVGADNEVEPNLGFVLHAMRWNRDGSFAELPLAPGAVRQQAEAINNHEVIVGYAELPDLSTRAVRWDAQGAHLLANRACCYAWAGAINDSGTAVGYVSTATMAPAKWSPSGTLTTLALPAGDNFGFANAINNRGQIVGATGFVDGPNISHHAVIWAADGSPSVLPLSESSQDDATAAVAINDHGIIAGLVDDPATSFGMLPVLWFKGRRIFVPPGSTPFTDVNDLTEDRIVGSILTADERHVARWSFTLRFQFRGFFPPVTNPGTAPYHINQVKAGQPIPVRFSLAGNEGLKIFGAGSPASKKVGSCAPSGLGGATPIRMGAGGLSYDKATDRYEFVWQTETSWKNTCRQLSVTLVDGTTRKALFRFTPRGDSRAAARSRRPARDARARTASARSRRCGGSPVARPRRHSPRGRS